MLVRTPSSAGAARWAALALGCALLVGGCSGDDGSQPADEQDQQAEPAATEDEVEDGAEDEQPASDDETQDEQAAGEGAGDCALDAGTVNEIVDIDVELELDDVIELANDGTSCIYDGGTDDLDVIVSVSEGTWDGTDERVESVLSRTEEYYGEPVGNPDLGDQAFLFENDFGGSSLVVFVGDMQYSIGFGGGGFAGTPLESSEERLAMASELYEAASA